MTTLPYHTQKKHNHNKKTNKASKLYTRATPLKKRIGFKFWFIRNVIQAPIKRKGTILAIPTPRP